jgi:hypothetical protein
MMLRREDDLRFPVPIAQVDENDTSQIAACINPATECHGLAYMLCP